jgi:malate dehydrogenase
MHDWWVGTKEGEYCSMGVIADHSKYGVQTGVCYSFPVVCKGGEW